MDHEQKEEELNVTTTETDQLLHVPIQEVEPDPEQPRRNFDPEGEHASLVASVRQHGILNPITVRPLEEGRYMVVTGERRWRAAKEAGLETIPALLREGGEARVLALVENVVRFDLNPIEEGDAYAALADSGRSLPEIAELVSRPLERVRDRIALSTLPAAARRAIVAGEPMSALRALTVVKTGDPDLAEALAFGAEQGVYSWTDLADPARCLFKLLHADLTVETITCPKCNGIGMVTADGEKFDSPEAADEAEGADECDKCEGTGVIEIEAAEPLAMPAFFAVAVDKWGRHDIGHEMIEQLTDDAKARVHTASQRAAAYYASKSGKGYINRPPAPSLHGEEILMAAQAMAVTVDLGNGREFVVSPEFVSEYLPDLYEKDVEEYVSPSRTRDGVATREPKKPKDEMTPEEIAEDEATQAQRAEDRKRAADERATARQFNGDLGAALAQIGEVKVTTDAMKLLVATIFEHTRPTGYNGRSGEGHALWQRYVRTDWPTKKNGDAIIPRSTTERSEFAQQVDEEFDRYLARAKTPDQALAVLVRYLGAGLADLRGLPHADLDGAVPYQAGKRFRPLITKLLPAGLRRRVPSDNGIPGSSFSWGD